MNKAAGGEPHGPISPGMDASSQSRFPPGFLLQSWHGAPYCPASNPELGHFSTLLTSNRFKICKYNTEITQSGIGP